MAAAALLVLVAVGSQARRGSSGGVVHPLGLRVVGDVVVSVAAVILAAGVVLWVVVLLAPRRRRWSVEEEVVEIPPAAWWEKLVAVGIPVAVGALVAVLVVRSAGSGLVSGRSSSPLGGLPLPGGSGSRPGGGGVGGGLDWPVVVGVVVVAGVAAAAVLWVWRHRGLAVPEPQVDRMGLGAVGEAGLEELVRERDPRRAVIRAYGAMTALLGRWGLPRRPSETPFEFLERALVGLGASSGAARRLTVLFEWARFSDHSVTESQRTEAVNVVRGLRGMGDGG